MSESRIDAATHALDRLAADAADLRSRLAEREAEVERLRAAVRERDEALAALTEAEREKGELEALLARVPPAWDRIDYADGETGPLDDLCDDIAAALAKEGGEG